MVHTLVVTPSSRSVDTGSTSTGVSGPPALVSVEPQISMSELMFYSLNSASTKVLSTALSDSFKFVANVKILVNAAVVACGPVIASYRFDHCH